MIPCKHSFIWLVLGLSLFVATSHAASGPLRVRNVFPAAQLYGLPRALGAEILDEGVELTFNIEHSNNFSSESKGNTLAFFDGETSVLSYGYRHVLADGFESSGALMEAFGEYRQMAKDERAAAKSTTKPKAKAKAKPTRKVAPKATAKKATRKPVSKK